MCRDAGRPRTASTGRYGEAGFGLVETLTALLIMAVVLLGTCAALIQSIGANRAAAVHTQAVDLAADIVESLRDEPSARQRALQIAQWQVRVAAMLPVGATPLPGFASIAASQALTPAVPQMVNASVRWWSPSTHVPTSLLLPVALSAVTPLP
jgi:Tfp pilus assembly protein PilV